MSDTYNKNCFENQNYNSTFLSSAFLRGITFGKGVFEFNDNLAIMSIKNKKDIILAIRKAYIDMSPRTFKKDKDWWRNPENVKNTKSGNPKEERLKTVEESWQNTKKELFDWLAEEFYAYFQTDCNNFENWHKKICDSFLEKFKPVLIQYGYDADSSLKYGKAQKIVNMTFKYLFCFDDSFEYIAKFDECHMPIDSYILKWYNHVSDDKCTVAWSDLEKDQYYILQKNIKNLLKGNNPFLAEFYIWAEYNR